MATYTTNLDFIHAEIIPALGDYAADFDLDGIWTDLRERDLVIYRTHADAAQLDGFEWVDGLAGDSLWNVVQDHVIASA